MKKMPHDTITRDATHQQHQSLAVHAELGRTTHCQEA
jgi:hypothetical protein